MPEMLLSAESLPAGRFDGQPSGREEPLLLLMVRGPGDTPPAGRKCCCCCSWKARKAANAGYWMLGDWRVWLDGMQAWSLNRKTRWEADAPSADFARDPVVPFSLYTKVPDRL